MPKNRIAALLVIATFFPAACGTDRAPGTGAGALPSAADAPDEQAFPGDTTEASDEDLRAELEQAVSRVMSAATRQDRAELRAWIDPELTWLGVWTTLEGGAGRSSPVLREARPSSPYFRRLPPETQEAILSVWLEDLVAGESFRGFIEGRTIRRSWIFERPGEEVDDEERCLRVELDKPGSLTTQAAWIFVPRASGWKLIDWSRRLTNEERRSLKDDLHAERVTACLTFAQEVESSEGVAAFPSPEDRRVPDDVRIVELASILGRRGEALDIDEYGTARTELASAGMDVAPWVIDELERAGPVQDEEGVYVLVRVNFVLQDMVRNRGEALYYPVVPKRLRGPDGTMDLERAEAARLEAIRFWRAWWRAQAP